MSRLAPCLENDSGGAGIRLQMNCAAAVTVVGDATKYYHVQASTGNVGILRRNFLCPLIEVLLKKFSTVEIFLPCQNISLSLPSQR